MPRGVELERADVLLLWLRTLDYGSRGRSFSEILLSKAEHDAGRRSTWMTIARSMSLQRDTTEPFEETWREVGERGLANARGDGVTIYVPTT